MSDRDKGLIRFGAFELNLNTGELWKHGLRVRLQEKTLTLLVTLLERPGEIVTREELHRRLWPDGIFVEFEHNLNSVVNRLREVLGDTTVRSRFIETAHRRGYRFLAVVDGGVELENRLPRVRIAVLPFENKSRDPEEEFVSDGLTEEVIARLGSMQSRGLGVIARNTAMRYKNTRKSISRLRQELHVDFLLTGSVAHTEKKVRVRVELVRSRDETVLWSDTFEQEIARSDKISFEIASRVLEILSVPAPSGAASSAAASQPVDPQAREAYFRGRHFWNKRTETGLRKALDYFKLAAEIDPNHALAYVGIADAYNVLSNRGYMRPLDAAPLAKEAVQKALKLNSNLAEAYAALGWTLFGFEWDRSGGEQAFQKAVQLNPGCVTARHAYGFYLIGTARWPECFDQIRAALYSDPLSLPTNGIYVWALFCSRQFDAAVEQARKTIELDPHYAAGYGYAAMVFAEAGLFEQAFQMGPMAVEESDGDPLISSCVGHALAKAGYRAEAERYLERYENLYARQYLCSSMIAPIAVALGDKDQAFVWLQRAVEDHSDWLNFLPVDPRMDSLRQDPRYAAILDKISPDTPGRAEAK